MREIAEKLLDINAVKLSPSEPFTWASGLKSPIYCDNRLTISYPTVRKEIAAGIKDLIKLYYPEVEMIAGTATAGIPHAAWVAELLDLPMTYVRSHPKDHGQGKQIEGVYSSGQKAVLIDDLLSTGGSVLQAAGALTDAGVEVLGIVGIFNYELSKLHENFAHQGLTYHTLTNYSELLAAVDSRKAFSGPEIDSMYRWKQDPVNWYQQTKH